MAEQEARLFYVKDLDMNMWVRKAVKTDTKEEQKNGFVLTDQKSECSTDEDSALQLCADYDAFNEDGESSELWENDRRLGS